MRKYLRLIPLLFLPLLLSYVFVVLPNMLYENLAIRTGIGLAVCHWHLYAGLRIDLRVQIRM